MNSLSRARLHSRPDRRRHRSAAFRGRRRRTGRAWLAISALVAGTVIAVLEATPAAAAGPPAGIAFRAASSATAQVRTGLQLPVPTGVQAGDVLLASIDVRGWTDPYTAPAGWTLLQDDLKSTAMRQATYVHVVGSAGEPATYVWSFTKGYEALGVIVAYSGVDNANPVDAENGTSSNAATAITAPSVAASAAGDMVVGFFGTSVAATITPPTATTGRGGAAWTAGSQTQTLAAADIPMSTSGATGALVATASVAAMNVGHTVALRPATSSPPPGKPLANDDAYSATSGVALAVPVATGVLANDTSPTGGSLQTALVSDVAHGTLTLNPDGSFRYVSATGFSGTDSFTYTAADAVGVSPPATVRITVTAPAQNRPPAVTSPGAQSSTEGDAISRQIVASDPDGDAITYAATGLPSGLSMSNSGAITGVIAMGAANGSPYSVTVTVTDAANASTSVTFAWQVASATAPGGQTVGLWHMNETSGTVMRDSSGYGNDGSIFETTVGVPGYSGSAYLFNGRSSIVTVPDAPSLNPGTADFSVLAWMKFTKIPGHDYDVMRKGLSTTVGGDFKFEIFTTDQGAQASCVARGSKNRAGVTAGPSLADGQWHKIGCVKTANSFSVYVDGVYYTQQRAIGAVSPADDMTVGAQPGADFTDGVIDEVTYTIG